MNLISKMFRPLSVVLLILAVVLVSCGTKDDPAAKGLTVSVTTSATATADYAPHNVVAIWIENSDGVFVKSLTVYGLEEKYRFMLTKWSESSVDNSTDAVTGASRTTHGVVKGTWNGTDLKGVVVPNGTYKVCMELTDKNDTGNYSEFSFVKGADNQTLTPANAASFSAISIKWMPL